MTREMLAVLQEPAEEENDTEDEVVTNGCTKLGCPKHPRKGDSTGAMRPKQKGARGSKGKADLGKTGSPKLAVPGDSERKVKDVLQRGFDDAKKGKKVSTGVQVGRHELVLAPGDVEHWGSHHAERPAHKKVTSERLAETTLHGASAKEKKDNSVTKRLKRNIVVLAPECQPSYPPTELPIRTTKSDRYVGKNWYRT